MNDNGKIKCKGGEEGEEADDGGDEKEEKRVIC